MPRISDKRERLVAAAQALIYQQGFNQTTLAEIAEASDVPLGNVYYYFRTKEDLVREVIAQRKDQFRILFNKLDEISEPKQRLYGLLDALEQNRKDVAKYGCPVGGLCLELNKFNPDIAPLADDLLKDMLAWTVRQFKAMGCADADELGVRLLVILQGASLLANALHKSTLLTQQFNLARAWIDAL